MKVKLEANTILSRGKDLPFSQLDNEVLAIDPQAGYCYSLNETAGKVWSLMTAPISFEALCAELRREYAVNEATCARDVRTLLEGLREAGLVEFSNTQTR